MQVAVILTPRPFYSPPPGPIAWEVGWAQESVLTVYEKKKSHAFIEIRTPDYPVRT